MLVKTIVKLKSGPSSQNSEASNSSLVNFVTGENDTLLTCFFIICGDKAVFVSKVDRSLSNKS